ncbi:hypothetical protein AS850_07760 [Frondihabitans sp. 762G35]|uniref:hypothetical protein n=1 Tax=Frondihabitans sp. 762G35 TaxID=1446794 RepID=UPI000D214797|nr:hypothetical protein [Frondihabitans sp. 762G35]ARC56973.1 hypothetical protein AS850_07760 [Frondihabitans sp. 762G35]
MPSLTYDVTVSRDGSAWLLEIAPIGGVAEARWLGEAEDVARAFVADFEGVDPEDVDIDLTVEFPGTVGEQLDIAERAHATAEQALDDEWNALTNAARELDRATVTRRDIGEILGLPVQRVRRLLRGAPRERRTSEQADDSEG